MDKYDEAITYLTENPNEIKDAWNSPTNHIAGCLFQIASHPFNYSMIYGCLTQIRDINNQQIGLYCKAETEKLTQAIRSDDRIPNSPNDITLDNLSIFAEWQRRLDTELQRA